MSLRTAITGITLTLALILPPALATAAGHSRPNSDVQEAKETADKVKKGNDAAKTLKNADAGDVKEAGKDQAKKEASDAAKDAIRDSVR